MPTGEEALKTYVQLGVPYEPAPARIVFARALASVGEVDRASAELGLAAEGCGKMSAATLLAAAEEALAGLGA